MAEAVRVEVVKRRRKSVEWRRVVVRGLKTEMTSGRAMILILIISLQQRG